MLKSKMEIKVTLSLPPKELNPNGRFHYMRKAKAKQAYRHEAKIASVDAGIEQDWPAGVQLDEAQVQVVYYHATKALRDPDNIIASLKSAFDGVTDSGLWTDDRDLTHLPVIREIDSKNPRVELHITTI